MTLTVLALFVPACFALSAASGTNNVQAFSNTSRLGFWTAIAAGLGSGMTGFLTPTRRHRLNRGVSGFLIFSGLTMALSERP